MLSAVATRWGRMQNRLVLEDIEMTPLPVGLVVVKLALRFALRARPANRTIVVEEYMNRPFLELEFDAVHFPWRVNPEKPAENLTIVHP